MSGSRLLLLLDQAADGIRRLRAFADPILGPLDVERTVLTGLLRIVRTDDFDKFPVARAAAIGNNDPVVWPVFRAFSA